MDTSGKLRRKPGPAKPAGLHPGGTADRNPDHRHPGRLDHRSGNHGQKRQSEERSFSPKSANCTQPCSNTRTSCGEYPPDFTGLNQDDNPAVDTPGEAAAKLVIDRHLKKRFPKFRGGWNQVVANLAQAPPLGYGIDATKLDSASALVFWLGGLPESPASTKPAGFHEDPINPFKPGLPRTRPLFEFSDDEERLALATPAGVLRCYYFPKGIKEKPYVYFRPQRAPSGEHTYWFMERNPAATGEFVTMVRTWPPVIPSLAPAASSERAVPYLDTAAKWHAEDQYQILSAGLGGLFGTRITPAPPVQSLAPAALPASTAGYVYPVTKTGVNFADDEYDDLTSVYAGKLEDAIE